MGEVTFHLVEVVGHRLVFGGQHFLPVAERFGHCLRFVCALIKQLDSLCKRVRLLIELADLMFDSGHALIESADLVLKAACPLVQLSELLFKGTRPLVEFGHLRFKGACPLIEIDHLLPQGTNPLFERFDRCARRFHLMQNFCNSASISIHLLFVSILQKSAWMARNIRKNGFH
ncbi:hypothetical protein [Geobacillus subterraneus]|uniref:hypothetical protein n=1 Tax=Geobacillus subterraneus TaxID=129338 RepID=UPI00161077E2